MLGFLPKLALGLAAAFFPLVTFAAAVVESMVGEVTVLAYNAKKPVVVKQGQRIASGSTITTGTDGLAILKFDDEMKMLVAPNSELQIIDYNYRASAASSDRAEFMLHRGALRVVTGFLAQRNYEMFVVRTPQVNLSVRGSDFSVTIVGTNSYWSVQDGVTDASTNVGKGAFGKGSYGRSQGLDRLAAGVARAGLPVAVLQLFTELNSAKATAQLGPAAVGTASAAAEPTTQSNNDKGGGFGVGTIAAVLAAIAAALVAAGSGGSSGGAAPPPSH